MKRIDIKRGKVKKEEPVILKMNQTQIDKLNVEFGKLPLEYRQGFLDWCKKVFNTMKFADFPQSGFDNCIERLNNTFKFIKDQKVA